MRILRLTLLLLVSAVPPAAAQVRVEVGVPNVSIGVDLRGYPLLARVPGLPVYYAPRLATNYFFFDGLYWVYTGDAWYESSWYNGPWSQAAPEDVPVYLLRVPVRYYREPPPYFRSWRADAPPRWGEHWGDDWQRRHDGWDRWNRRQTLRPAPLPYYQRRYTGPRYPQAPEQQRQLHGQYYRYEPRDPTVQRTYEGQGLRPHVTVPRNRAERTDEVRDHRQRR